MLTIGRMVIPPCLVILAELGIVLALLRWRKRMGETVCFPWGRSTRMNLLRFKPLRALVGSRYFPLVPQLAMLLVFCAIVAGGMVVGSHPRIAGYLSRTNLANQMVWNYWWPGVIILSVILGRAWCAVCPVELVSSLASTIGLKAKVPRIIKSGWVIRKIFL